MSSAIGRAIYELGVQPTLSPTMTLTPSPAAATVNGSESFTPQMTGVTLTPTAPSGTVSFKVNGVASTDCPDQPFATAVCTTKTLTVGHGTVTATYSGDSNYTFTGTAT